MDEMEFTEAESNVQDLVAEYQQVSSLMGAFSSPWPLRLTPFPASNSTKMLPWMMARRPSMARRR